MIPSIPQLIEEARVRVARWCARETGRLASDVSTLLLHLETETRRAEAATRDRDRALEQLKSARKTISQLDGQVRGLNMLATFQLRVAS